MIEKKNMYIVIKQDDAKKYLSQEEKHELINILGKISNGRMNDSKHPDNTYYVCNTDEPYADAVHKVILGGEVLKNENMSYCPDACGTSCDECFSN